MSELIVFVNGEFVPESQARISIFDHAVLYGDGVFETAVAWDGRVFKLEQHLDRLFRSLTAIHLEAPYPRSRGLPMVGTESWNRKIGRKSSVETKVGNPIVPGQSGQLPLRLQAAIEIGNEDYSSAEIIRATTSSSTISIPLPRSRYQADFSLEMRSRSLTSRSCSSAASSYWPLRPADEIYNAKYSTALKRAGINMITAPFQCRAVLSTTAALM